MSSKILSTTVLTCLLLGAASVAHAQSYEKVYTYGGGPGDGAKPYAGMIQTGDGMLYWTTSEGGANLCGAVFVAGGEIGVTILHSFTSDEGCNPTAGLLFAKDGFFYGTASTGGDHGDGTLFRMSPLGEVTVLHNFDAANALDGATPYFGVIQAGDGFLYGTTTTGGAYGFGTAYRADTNGAITVLHSFGETTSDGQKPSSPLIQAADGTFYGTTYGGGNPNPPDCDPCDRIPGGTVYQMTVSGNVGSIFNRFNFMVGGGNGDSPFGGLIQTGPTTFFGTTSSAEGLFSGSDFNAGTIFALDTSNDLAGLYTVHEFPYDFSEGAAPFATLIRAGDGNLYGTTGGLGETPSGVFRFRLDNSQLDVLHLFDPGSGDGYGPAAPLLEGIDGNLYGSTTGTIPFLGSGSAGFGTIFVLGMNLSGVVRQDQTITFGPLANKAVGDPDFFVSATSSSSLRVWFTASGSCTVSGAKAHLTGAGTCTITASQGGNADHYAAPSVPQSFTIVDLTPALMFSLSPASVTGGTNATGTVTLTAPAPNGGAVVTLSSSNAAAASVPATITIPKGKTSKTFAITTSAVTSATPVNITASYGGTTAPASLTVNPTALNGITLMPSGVKGGTSSTARITLTGPAPAGGLLVTMTSSNTSAAAVTNVTVPAGSSSATVAIATFKVNAATAVTITATGGGVSKSATLTVKK